MISKMFRYPGKGCSPDALTGDAVLDDYLIELDGKLIGSAKVRLHTLAEIKSHLVDRKDQLLKDESFTDDLDASRKAVEAYGDAAEQIAEQRKILLSRFRNTALGAGIYFGTVMAMFEFGKTGLEFSYGKVLFTWLFNGIFFGLFMGYFVVMTMPQRYLPSEKIEGEESQDPSAKEFEVRFIKKMQKQGRIGVWASMLASIICFYVGVTSVLTPGSENVLSFVWWVWIIMGVTWIVFSWASCKNMRVYRITEDGLSVSTYPFGKRQIAWAKVLGVGRYSELYPWIPTTGDYWARSRYIRFETESGKSKRLLLNPDMLNAERLLDLIEERLVDQKSGGTEALAVAPGH